MIAFCVSGLPGETAKERESDSDIHSDAGATLVDTETEGPSDV